MADTKSLIIADVKEVFIRNLYREEKNYKQPIQMYCYSADTNVADTVTPSRLSLGNILFACSQDPGVESRAIYDNTISSCQPLGHPGQTC